MSIKRYQTSYEINFVKFYIPNEATNVYWFYVYFVNLFWVLCFSLYHENHIYLAFFDFHDTFPVASVWKRPTNFENR